MAIDTEELATSPTEGPTEEAAEPVDADLAREDVRQGVREGEEAPPERPPVRVAAAVAFPTIACAVMVGGVFTGASPRVYAAVAGLLGIALAVGVSRMGGRTLLTHSLVAAGLFGIGLAVLLPDFGDVIQVADRIDAATKDSSVLRPPVEFEPGWNAIQGWLMGTIGFTAAWVAVVIRWRAAALLLPLPVAAVAGISVPEEQQVASGLAVLVLFAVGLGLVSSEQAADDESRPSTAYEARKALKALPLIGLITLGLYFLAQTDFLFPDPLYDPAQQPQRPRVQPLSEVDPERVLFEVTETKLTGPFRMGSLDTYTAGDGYWRLPAFANAQIQNVPRSGIVDEEQRARQELRATFTVRGLGGAVLATLPNTVGIAARGPRLGYDHRNHNIRLVNGQAEAGLVYSVSAAGLPSVLDLQTVRLDDLPGCLRELEDECAQPTDTYLEIPDRPQAVEGLIDQAPKTSEWDEFDYLRTWILANVTVTGTGRPVAVGPERVADMIAGSKQGSPFEIVAAQAMLARWIGVPSRIGYGFDGGELVDDVLKVRPVNGAAWVEVWFPGYNWLPVIGTPLKAEPTVGSDPSTQRQDLILPSNEVEGRFWLPVPIPPRSVLAKQVAVSVLIGFGVLLFLYLLYVAFPAVRKAQLRARRREEARKAGTRARIVEAYAEWRDYAADLGFHHRTDTPLMFLERFVDDDEHDELAWLTTRVLWGDLRHHTDAELAPVAEELSRSLRRRLASVQPASLRAVAVLSRISLRDPYVSHPAGTVSPDGEAERPDDERAAPDREPAPARPEASSGDGRRESQPEGDPTESIPVVTVGGAP